MKLELKHLAPYLPYKLQLGNEYSISGIMIACEDYIDDEGITTQQGYKGAHDDGTLFYSSFKTGMKPILRPLSDLTKEIEVNGEKFVPMEKIIPLIESHQEELNKPLSSNPFEAMLINLHSSNNIYNKLLELHFDIFGLIKEGLAIDINTL